MKRTEAMPVGEILKAMMECDGNIDQFEKQKACFIWSEVVGPTINRATTKRYIQGDTLHVYISSGPIKNELSFMATSIITHINEAVGKNIIKKISIH